VVLLPGVMKPIHTTFTYTITQMLEQIHSFENEWVRVSNSFFTGTVIGRETNDCPKCIHFSARTSNCIESTHKRKKHKINKDELVFPIVQLLCLPLCFSLFERSDELYFSPVFSLLSAYKHVSLD